MGERKGQNKYYPPDFDYKIHKSLSGYHGEHALRERAKRIDEGILIIRFEMPFNMWCGGCHNHIGMGVRYNAEKSKVGKYYSTPIFKFRMRCHLCPNYIEIQTDPQKACYVVVSGGERREQRWDPAENNQIAPEAWENKKKLALDSMYKLEHSTTDELKGKQLQSNFTSLLGNSDWKNEHLVSRVFSKYFKNEKRKRKQNEEFKKKYAFDIDLLSDDEEETDEVAKKSQKTDSFSTNNKLKSFSNNSLAKKLSEKNVNAGGIMDIVERTYTSNPKKSPSLSLKDFNIKIKTFSKNKDGSTSEPSTKMKLSNEPINDNVATTSQQHTAQEINLAKNTTSNITCNDSSKVEDNKNDSIETNEDINKKTNGPAASILTNLMANYASDESEG